MSFVLNDWLPHPSEPRTTILRITGVYSVDALVSTDDLIHIKHHSWCYEQAKGNVYTMDPTMELPTLLNVASPRIYLWKYIVYIHTGRIAKAWRRKNLLDYRFNAGVVQYMDEVPVA